MLGCNANTRTHTHTNVEEEKRTYFASFIAFMSLWDDTNVLNTHAHAYTCTQWFGILKWEKKYNLLSWFHFHEYFAHTSTQSRIVNKYYRKKNWLVNNNDTEHTSVTVVEPAKLRNTIHVANWIIDKINWEYTWISSHTDKNRHTSETCKIWNNRNFN